MIKFYNPWKPHIVEDGFGRFWIRKTSPFGWQYYSTKDDYFYVIRSFADNYTSLDSAKEVLRRITAVSKRKNKKDKVVK